MSFTVIARFQCTRKRFGHQSQENASFRKTTAAHRLTKAISGGNRTTASKVASEKQIRALDQEPKPYGSHEGNTHSAILLKTTCNTIEEVTKLINQLDKAARYVENSSSINIKEAKAETLRKDTEVAARYRKEFGPSLNDKQMNSYREECVANAISYHQSQVTILVYSDTQFEGAREDKDHKVWVIGATCKARNTTSFIPASYVSELKDIIASKDDDKQMRVSAGATHELQQDGKGHIRFATKLPQAGEGLLRQSTSFKSASWETIMGDQDDVS